MRYKMTKIKKTEPKQILVSQKQEIHSIEYRGALPPPAMLAQYDQIEKGFADRIITMAEKQQEHRFELEKQGLKSMFERDKRIQWIAWSIIALFIIWGFTLLALGRKIEWYGTLWFVITSFIAGWAINKKSENKGE